MKILLEFYLIKKNKIEENNDDKFLFWSCVLDTSIEKVDFNHLNIENEHKIEDFKSIFLRMKYNEYSEITINDIINKYQKRPVYFIATDKTFMTGSPYKHSSSLVETYYQDTIEFVQQLKEFCDFNSDYKLNLLQQNILKLINNLIGIDILKNESTAGALSIYNKLPAFIVGGNFNLAKGKRYITIYSIDDLFAYQDITVQIEITDNDKILYNTLQSLSSNFKHEFPDHLEDFSQLHVFVLGKRKGETIVSKIYEEKFHLIQYWLVD